MQRPKSARSRLWSKSTIVGGYWLAQTVVVLYAPRLLVCESWSDLASVDVLDVFSDPQYVTVMLLIAAAVIGMQTIFLWPVRKPTAPTGRGWPIRLSLGVAGLAVAFLVTALLLASVSLFHYFIQSLSIDETTALIIVAGVLALSWLIATPLLIAFSGQAFQETLLGRVAVRVFGGTILEMLAIIPIDVMVRRRTNCYCGEGTYLALCLCTAVGLFALGPCILLPILARRRQWWYQRHCSSCGYDMHGLPKADCCPECGAKWTPCSEKGSSRGDSLTSHAR